jgi:hypothetical protein
MGSAVCERYGPRLLGDPRTSDVGRRSCGRRRPLTPRHPDATEPDPAGSGMRWASRPWLNSIG